MSDEAKKIERRDAFTLSMVDLFGCGFISAVFLFIFNMIQPQIDAMASGGASAGIEGEQTALYSGQSGAAFVLISANQDLTFSDWETAPPARISEGGTVFNYEQFLPDAGRIVWPFQISVQPKATGTPLDIQFSLIFGSSVATIAVEDWMPDAGENLPVAFGYDGHLVPELDAEFGYELRVDALPDRTIGVVYAYQAVIASDQPVTADLAWIGPARRVSWKDNTGTSGLATPGDGSVCTFSLANPAAPASCDDDLAKASELNGRLSRSMLSVRTPSENG